MEQLKFDTIILGGGPAGLASAIYSARGAVSTAVIDKNMFGGQPSNYLELENYPGFQVIGGYDLKNRLINSGFKNIQCKKSRELIWAQKPFTPKIIYSKQKL